MMRSRTKTLVAGLLAFFIFGAPCCGEVCSSRLIFNGPVPDMRLAPGDTTSYELFGNVWTLASSCDDGRSYGRFPEAFVASEDPDVATVRLEQTAHDEPSRVHVQAHAPGQTTVVVRVRYELDCEDELDVTHFTVTVAP